jgi:hypothetical protein
VPEAAEERYVVRRPIAAGGCLGVQGCDATRRTFLSDEQIPGCGHYLDMTWIYADSQPGRYATERVLDHDQYLLHLGMDWERPQRLGATVEFHLGGQPITFSTMTSIYIPAGVAYGPLSWKEFHRPHIQLCLVFGSGGAPVGRPVERAPVGSAVPGIAGVRKISASISSATWSAVPCGKPVPTMWTGGRTPP